MARGHRLPVLLAALLAALALAVFWPATDHAFIEEFDDSQYVTRNPWMRVPFGPDSVRWAFTSMAYAANWHPLTWLSHLLDVRLFGFNPGLHHLMSLLWHAANTVLLFLLLRAFTGAALRSAFVAALFAVHPLHVESVAWVAERKDLLSTFFWLLTMGSYLRYVRRPGVRRYLLVALCLALGLMAKPMVVSLPLALLLLDFWPLGRFAPPWARVAAGRASRPAPASLLLEKAPLLLLSAAAAVVTLLSQQRGSAVRTLELYPFDARLGNALVSGVTYVSKMIWPRSLSFYYPFPAIPWPWWVVLGSGAILAVVTFIALRQASRQPFLAFGWAWYLLTLVPVIGLVQVGDQAMADRYTYVPLIGLFVLVAWGGATLLWTAARPFPAAAWIVPAGVLVGLSLAARQQLSYWKDDITLIGRAIEVTAGNVLAHNNLGNALMRERRTGEAIAHYTEALRLRPDYTLAHYNLANALRDEQRTQEALHHYREALRLDPGYLPPRNNMGLILNALGRTAEAEIVFRQGLAIDPGAADICNNLGLLLLEGGRVEESLDLFVRAVQAQPSNGNSRRNLAAALERLGRTREAAGHYREALLVNPGDVEARFRLERLSRLPARD